MVGQGVGALPPGPGGPQQQAGNNRASPMTGPPHALRSVMPPFMFRGGQPMPPGPGSGYPPIGGYQMGPRGPAGGSGQSGRYTPPSSQQQDARGFRQGPRMVHPGGGQQQQQQQQGESTDLYPRPIIKEEDLKRMDEISGDDGWAAFQDEPDYDKKLFNDDEVVATAAAVPNDDGGAHAQSLLDEEMIKMDRDGKWADNVQAQGRAITVTPPQVQLLNREQQHRGGRDGGYGPQGPRHQQQQSNNLNSGGRPFPSLDEEEFWKEKQMQQKSVEMKAALRAKEMR